MEHPYLDFDIHLLTKNLDRLCPILQPSTEGSFSLIANHEQQCFRVFPGYVSGGEGPCSGTHATGGDDNMGLFNRVHGLGLILRSGITDPGKGQRVVSHLYEVPGLGIEARRVTAVDFPCRYYQGTVYEALDAFERSRFCIGIELIKNLLSPAHGKGRYYHIASILHGLQHRLEKLLSPPGPVTVLPLAVGRLEHLVVGLLDLLGGCEEGSPRPALIAAEDDLPIIVLTIYMP